MIDIKIKRAIRDAIVALCKDEADTVMFGMIDKHKDNKELSRSLYKSKFFTNSNRGSNQHAVRSTMQFGFKDNEEADALEKGAPAKPFSGTFTQNVKEHKRELGKPKTSTQKIARTLRLKKKRSTTVKKHTRTYKNMKPVQLANGDWIISKGIPKRKGKQPLYKGISKIMKDDNHLARRLQQLIKL